MINKMFFKEILIAATLLAASGYTVTAQAHCLNDQTIVNNSNTFQWDTYVAICPASATGMSGKISKQSQTGGGAGTVSMEIGKGGFGHTTASDASSVAAGSTSSCNAGGNIALTGAATAATVPTLSGGPGQYTIVVSKNSASTTTYDMEWHCVDTVAPIDPLVDAPDQQGGPLVGLGLTDSLDAVSGSALIANDTNDEINIPFNH